MAEVQDKFLHQSSSKEVRGQSMLTVSPTVSPAEVYRIKLFITILLLLIFYCCFFFQVCWIQRISWTLKTFKITHTTHTQTWSHFHFTQTVSLLFCLSPSKSSMPHPLQFGNFFLIDAQCACVLFARAALLRTESLSAGWNWLGSLAVR